MTTRAETAASTTSRPPSATRLAVGDIVPTFAAESLDGQSVRVPRVADDGSPRWTLVSFLRYASCPMCNLRMRELAAALPMLSAGGADVVVLLHSPPKRARAYTPTDLASRVVADPSRFWYRRFGLEPSWARLASSLLLPSFYVAWVKAMLLGYWGGWIDGHFAMMPADFLVGPDGRLRLVHYGGHIGDHVDVEDVIAAISASADGAVLAR